MQRWSRLLRVTMTRAWGCSGSELGILAQGVSSNPSGGGARGRQWARWDWPGAGPQGGRAGLPKVGGASLTAGALWQVASLQVEVGRFRRLWHPRG